MRKAAVSFFGNWSWFTLGICGCLVAHSVLGADYYVAKNGQTPGDFRSWGAAASNIQDAVNAAAAKDTVWVGAGQYTAAASPVVSINKTLTLRGSNSLAPAASAISGNLASDVVIDGGGGNRGVLMTFPINVTIVLDGLTISNCYSATSGGGISMQFNNVLTTGVVQNCLIRDNIAVNVAGGIDIPDSNQNSRYAISNCVIRGNSGGGLQHYLRNSAGGRGMMSHCLVENNVVTNGNGAGIMFQSGTLSLDYCVMRGNRATKSSGSGGAIHVRGGDLTLVNCLINNNSCGLYGGAIYFEGGNSALLQNCTIVSNMGGGYSGVAAFPALQVCNSIIYFNGADNTANISKGYYTNSCTYPSNAYVTNGAGNITNNPAFVDVVGQDFHLSSRSPCLNTGTNQASRMTGAKDLDGNPRVDQGSLLVDMGCYEFVYSGGTIILLR